MSSHFLSTPAGIVRSWTKRKIPLDAECTEDHSDNRYFESPIDQVELIISFRSNPAAPRNFFPKLSDEEARMEEFTFMARCYNQLEEDINIAIDDYNSTVRKHARSLECKNTTVLGYVKTCRVENLQYNGDPPPIKSVKKSAAPSIRSMSTLRSDRTIKSSRLLNWVAGSRRARAPTSSDLSGRY